MQDNYIALEYDVLRSAQVSRLSFIPNINMFFPCELQNIIQYYLAVARMPV